MSSPRTTAVQRNRRARADHGSSAKAPRAAAPDAELGTGSSSADVVPRSGDGRPAALPVLAKAARGCRACPLWEHATQTVFGEGPASAALMLVGEQPGDAEDRAGHPFVGPAGKLLDRALIGAGLDRSKVYMTNAVKHFSFTQSAPGARRLHAKPKGRDVKACSGWLGAEITRVQPRVIVALGATAAQALLGPAFRLTVDRGRAQRWPGLPAVFATYHPSALLRAPDAEARRQMFDLLVQDLQAASAFAAAVSP